MTQEGVHAPLYRETDVTLDHSSPTEELVPFHAGKKWTLIHFWNMVQKNRFFKPQFVVVYFVRAPIEQKDYLSPPSCPASPTQVLRMRLGQVNRSWYKAWSASMTHWSHSIFPLQSLNTRHASSQQPLNHVLKERPSISLLPFRVISRFKCVIPLTQFMQPFALFPPFKENIKRGRERESTN